MYFEILAHTQKIQTTQALYCALIGANLHENSGGILNECACQLLRLFVAGVTLFTI